MITLVVLTLLAVDKRALAYLSASRSCPQAQISSSVLEMSQKQDKTDKLKHNLAEDVTEALVDMFSAQINEEMTISLDEYGNAANIRPRALSNTADNNVWIWWQARQGAESVLKSAIASEEVDIRPYFERYKQFLVLEKAEILQAHSDFFSAMTDCDFDTMSALWADDSKAVCLMPGRDQTDVLSGTRQIMARWLTLFDGTSSRPRHSWTPRHVKLKFLGDFALVTCEAQERSRATGHVIARHRVMSVFTRRSHEVDRHLLLASMSSPVVGSAGMDASTGSSSQRKRQRHRDARSRTFYRDPTAARRRGRGGGGGGGVLSLQQLLGNGLGGGNGMEGMRDSMEDNDDDDDEEEDEEEEEEEEEEDDIDVEVRALDDDEGDDDPDVAEVRNLLQERIRNSLRQAISRISDGDVDDDGAPKTEVVIIGRNGLSAASSPTGSRRDGSHSGSGRGDKRGIPSAAPHDEGEGSAQPEVSGNGEQQQQQQQHERRKELAAMTLLAVRWLYHHGHISDNEKTLVTSDIIRAVAQRKLSQAEVAFSLLIGAGRPDEEVTQLPADMSLVDDGDMDEFCDVCHVVAKKAADACGDDIDDDALPDK